MTAPASASTRWRQYKDHYDDDDARLLQRCNLVTDCPDQSDEADCDLLQLDDDYRNDELLLAKSLSINIDIYQYGYLLI